MTAYSMYADYTYNEYKRIETENPTNKDEQQRQKENLLRNCIITLEFFIEKSGNEKQYPQYTFFINHLKDHIGKLFKDKTLQNMNYGKTALVKRLNELEKEAEMLLPLAKNTRTPINTAVPATAAAPAAVSLTTSTAAATATNATATAMTVAQKEKGAVQPSKEDMRNQTSITSLTKGNAPTLFGSAATLANEKEMDKKGNVEDEKKGQKSTLT